MIKATAGKGSNEDIKILGLSEANIQLLKANKPIKFDGNEIGLPGTTFLIVYGKTEEDILNDFRQQGLLKL